MAGSGSHPIGPGWARPPAGTHPPLNSPAYRSTAKRAPGRPLVPLAPGASPLGIAMLIGHQLLSDGFETVWEANQAAIRGRVLPANFQGRANAANEIGRAHV